MDESLFLQKTLGHPRRQCIWEGRSLDDTKGRTGRKLTSFKDASTRAFEYRGLHGPFEVINVSRHLVPSLWQLALL